ncbi:SRPBCC family protein [Mycolicibacterium phlei]
MVAPTLSADVEINADPETVYRLITDLPTMAQLAEEAYAMEWVKGDSARPGAVFQGRNRNGSHKWTTRCTVTAAEPGRTFAFDVHGGPVRAAHWRYDIEPTGNGGCRVTESTWDHRPGWLKIAGGWVTGVKDRTGANAKHVRLTLDRLKQRAESN